MKRYFTSVVLLAFTYLSYSQQIEINNTYTPEELIEDVLFQGCIEVSNVVSSVNGGINGITSYGYFQKGGSNFPFTEGIMLTTGDAMDAGNSLITEPLNQGETSWGTDDDLEEILNVSNTLNATVIEFDFIAATDVINFNYILASEEYLNEYPCNYSDSFAFLIKPNDNSEPYTNITLVPGTTTNVSTQNIRPEIVGFCDSLNEEYFEGFNVGDTNYNGRTTVLTANANILPNTSYHIKLMIADQFDENFDSAVFLEGNTFVSTVELSDNISTCYSSTTLDTGITNPEATFSWSFNNVPLPQTSSVITAENSGTYHVTVDIPYNNAVCSIEATVEVTINAIQEADSMENFELCETSENLGIATFNLSEKDNEALASTDINNASVHYFLSETDRENNTNELSGLLQNTENPQTIYVLITNEETGCKAYTTFDLVVNTLPVLSSDVTLYLCDEGNDNTEVFNLNEIGLLENPTEANLSFSYYLTEDEAENNQNNLPVNYNNTDSPQTIYVRAQDNTTGCISIGTATLELKEAPVANSTTIVMNACNPDNEEFDQFNLIAETGNFIENPEDYTISYHNTESDANEGVNAIEDPENYTNTNAYLQNVFVRIEDPNTGCFDIAYLNLYTSYLLTESNLDNYSICDDSSNDGIAAFDLEAIEAYITSNLDSNPTVQFYANETDQALATNQLNQTTPFVNTNNPQVLYVTLRVDECEVQADILLTVNPYFEVAQIDNQTVCDTDSDGFTTVETNTFTPLIDPDNQYNIDYYLTEDEAISETNSITNFINTETTQTIWVNITNNAGDCSSISNFEVTVLAAPNTQTPNNIVICDDNNDGFYNVNLNNVIPDVIENTDNLAIAFFNSYQEAENNNNAIENTTTYNTNSTTLYIRVTNTNTGCFSIEPFEVIVVYFPELSENYTLELCETDGDGAEVFFLVDFDSEIIQEQYYLETSYFETEADANNNTNSIDKNSGYTNLENPQQIYLRRESPSEDDCYTVDTVYLRVNSYPVFEAPEDLFLCDDISNDGFETFNLLESLENINPSYEITFYASLNDLYNNNNAIDNTFTNTVNPQTIYVKVNSSAGCYEAESFELNVVQVGEINQPDPVFLCDQDDNGYEIIDLTSDDIEVLMIRQYDVTIAYYETAADASLETNAIDNPENYQVNIANEEEPTVVYIVVTNNTSGCSLTVPLEIWISGLPTFTSNYQVGVCQDSNTSLTPSFINPLDIVNTTTNVTLTYFTNYTNALNNTNAIEGSIPINSTENNVIWVRATNTLTGCSNIKEIAVTIYLLPNIDSPDDMHVCTFAATQQIDLTSQNVYILGNLNSNNFNIKYFLSEEEALLDSNEIENPEAFEAYNEEIIYATAENTNTHCSNITSFQVFLHQLPESGAASDYVLCYNDMPLVIDADTGNENDTYQWYNNDTSSAIEITQPGVYNVTITNEFGCSITQYIGVTASESATITDIDVVSFSENNSITVSITGDGDYLFSLDDGTSQTSNVFENVQIGYHTVAVIDRNGCTATIATNVVVLGFPKYFTPNGDGVNDSWNVFGFETLENSYVAIFDRYGKLLKVLHPNDNGWDGTYNGTLMPSNDYWFKAFIYDVDEPFEQTGHFSLKR